MFVMRGQGPKLTSVVLCRTFPTNLGDCQGPPADATELSCRDDSSSAETPPTISLSAEQFYTQSILLLLFLCSVQVFSSLLTQEILQSIMASCEFLLYGPSEAFFALHQQAYG